MPSAIAILSYSRRANSQNHPDIRKTPRPALPRPLYRLLFWRGAWSREATAPFASFREGRWEGYPRSIFVLPLREITPWDVCWGATFLLPLKLLAN
jgi:hypothetical protein